MWDTFQGYLFHWPQLEWVPGEGDVRDSLDVEKGVAQPEEDVFLWHPVTLAKESRRFLRMNVDSPEEFEWRWKVWNSWYSQGNDARETEGSLLSKGSGNQPSIPQAEIARFGSLRGSDSRSTISRISASRTSTNILSKLRSSLSWLKFQWIWANCLKFNQTKHFELLKYHGDGSRNRLGNDPLGYEKMAALTSALEVSDIEGRFTLCSDWACYSSIWRSISSFNIRGFIENNFR